MKLLLLHGPAIDSSRKALSEIKNKFDPGSIVVFEKGADPKQIMDSLQTVPLFGEEQLIILENSSIDPSTLITENSEPITLLLWFDKEVDIKKFPNVKVMFFPEAKEVSVFPFLDYLGNKNKAAFTELEKLKKAGFESQYFITMVLYLLRNLIATPTKAGDFVKRKNAKMRENFKEEELISLYKSVLEIDFKIKKGLMETSHADHLLVSRFLN
jgi:DNA polymerase III delta subunit